MKFRFKGSTARCVRTCDLIGRAGAADSRYLPLLKRLFVTAGIGTSILPIRLAPPDILLLETV